MRGTRGLAVNGLFIRVRETLVAIGAREASLRRLRRVPLEYCQRKRRRKQGVKGEEEVESKTGEGLRRSETYAIYFFAINPQHNLLRPRGSEEKCSK